MRARLVGQASFQSMPSKGPGESGQLPALEDTMVTSLSELRLMGVRRGWIPDVELVWIGKSD